MAEHESSADYNSSQGCASFALAENVRKSRNFFTPFQVSIDLANGYGSKDENGAWNGMIKEVLEEVGVACS